MKHLAIFTLLIGVALCVPTSTEIKEGDNRITTNIFPDQLKIYSADHDIVNILFPLNDLNVENDDDNYSNYNATLFFVEADVKDGVYDYKGLYVLKNKEVKKLLETGTDAAAASDDSKTAFFGATDGLYVYNEKYNTAVKTPITDSIISIAKVNGSDIVYILTDKNELYKVSDEGNKKEKVDDVVGAQQIVLDYANNLYYYDADKQVYVVNEDGIKKIEGLPSNPTHVNLLKPPTIISEGIPVIVDQRAYIIHANGSSKLTIFKFEVKPTAYSMESTLLQYYGYNKNIYEYNIFTLIQGGLLPDLQDFFNNHLYEIQTFAKSKSEA